MVTIRRQESESSFPLDALQTMEDSALQEQLYKTLWESSYRRVIVTDLSWLSLSFRKLNETLSKENAMFDKYLKRLDRKDVQMRGAIVQL